MSRRLREICAALLAMHQGRGSAWHPWKSRPLGTGSFRDYLFGFGMGGWEGPASGIGCDRRDHSCLGRWWVQSSLPGARKELRPQPSSSAFTVAWCLCSGLIRSLFLGCCLRWVAILGVFQRILKK